MARSSSERGNPLAPLLPILLLLVIGGLVAGGIWFVKNYRHLFAPKTHEVKIFDPSKNLPVEKPKPVKPVEPVVEKPSEPPPPPPPKVKTLAEMQAEAAAAKAKLAAALAEARKADVAPLPGFAGIRFGDVAAGRPIREEALPEGGIAAIFAAEPLAKPFRSFGRVPLVWATPKTHRIFRIELSAPLKPGEAGEKETAQTVAALERYAKRPALTAGELPLVEREWIFPRGESRLEVRVCGGVRLEFVAEDEALRRTVGDETPAFRKDALSTEGATRALNSNKYPNGGAVRVKGVRLKDATPRSFCGVVFGTSAPPHARLANPRKGERGFFLDYRQQKCAPFFEFDHGKASVSRATGAVYAVELYSDGPTAGLSADDYVRKVKGALERTYKTKMTPGSNGEETLSKGDFNLRFAPDSNGGYVIRAEVGKYATAEKTFTSGRSQ